MKLTFQYIFYPNNNVGGVPNNQIIIPSSSHTIIIKTAYQL